jgi:hypothetical protein
MIGILQIIQAMITQLEMSKDEVQAEFDLILSNEQSLEDLLEYLDIQFNTDSQYQSALDCIKRGTYKSAIHITFLRNEEVA